MTTPSTSSPGTVTVRTTTPAEPVWRLARVSGASMAPTLRPADLLLVARLRRGRGVRRGDVVVLRRGGVRMVKRVVAVAGNVVELTAGRLTVGGRALGGGTPAPGALTQAWRVPDRSVFVVGDDLAASDDSRVWELPYVGLGEIEGRVLARLPRPAWARPGRDAVSRRRPAAAAPPAARS